MGIPVGFCEYRSLKDYLKTRNGRLIFLATCVGPWTGSEFSEGITNETELTNTLTDASRVQDEAFPANLSHSRNETLQQAKKVSFKS